MKSLRAFHPLAGKDGPQPSEDVFKFAEAKLPSVKLSSARTGFLTPAKLSSVSAPRHQVGLGVSRQTSPPEQLVEERFPEEPIPVPTTSCCIVIMCFQYVIIYTALALCSTYHEFKHTKKGAVEVSLRAAAQTLAYGPMACVLFIACRMHVEFLSEGKGQPQIWVQNCMYAVTLSVMVSTLLALIMPSLNAESTPLEEGPDEVAEGGFCEHIMQTSCKHQSLEEGTNMQAHPTSEEDNKLMLKLQEFPSVPDSGNEDARKLSSIMQAHPRSEEYNKFVRYDLMAVRYMLLICLYGGLAGVIAGTLAYSPPGPSNQFVLPAPAVMCTMILSVVFFATQLVNAICASYTEFTGVQLLRIVGVMNSAATTSEFAPMLAVLFLSARMRALQHNGEPQAWAQVCMYAGTFSMCTTTLLAVAVPLIMGGAVTVRTNVIVQSRAQQSTFVVPDAKIRYVLMALRYKCMLVCYGAALGVMISIFHCEAQAGPDATPPVSPAVHCVVSLACQFFVVYFLMTLMLAISELSGGLYPLESYRFFAAIESARATVSFAPMLSMIFVTTRMYALLITDKQGSPPAWAQFGMYMATWSLMISIMMCLITGLVMGDVDTDEEGNVVNKFTNWYLGMAITIVRYMAMLCLYGGMALVIIDLFTMTPQTAETINGRASIPEMQWWRLYPPMGTA